MLGMKTYTEEFINACESRVDADLRAYKKQVSEAPSEEFEVHFFNDQVLLLDYMFVHRLSGIEGKDGNPLNEVRVLCNSLMFNEGNVQVEKLPGWPNSAVSSLQLPPGNSVLGLKAGDDVKLSEDDFVRLSKAFFAEIKKKYL